MNSHHFEGRLASAPTLTRHGNTTVCRIRLLRSQYAGKDDAGESTERTVGINFTAFGGLAEHISKHFMEGDQAIVTSRVEDNAFEKDGQTHYSYNFIVQEINFGAPGSRKREQLAANRA